MMAHEIPAVQGQTMNAVEMEAMLDQGFEKESSRLPPPPLNRIQSQEAARFKVGYPPPQQPRNPFHTAVQIRQQAPAVNLSGHHPLTAIASTTTTIKPGQVIPQQQPSRGYPRSAMNQDDWAATTTAVDSGGYELKGHARKRSAGVNQPGQVFQYHRYHR